MNETGTITYEYRFTLHIISLVSSLYTLISTNTALSVLRSHRLFDKRIRLLQLSDLIFPAQGGSSEVWAWVVSALNQQRITFGID